MTSITGYHRAPYPRNRLPARRPPLQRPRTLSALRVKWSERDGLYADRPMTALEVGFVRRARMDEAAWVERELQATAYLEAANWLPPRDRGMAQ